MPLRNDFEFLIRQSTRAANWVAEVVRRDLNPAFFAVSGKFTLTEQDGLGYVTRVLEFTSDQRKELPKGLDIAQPQPPADEDDDEE